ncbi:MAG: hypothetical protein EOO75_13285 [Myxococcales bacterium]|nr:MAG: hypothetical protein EOO75_13285 [Myxococcales bacterium]
MLSSLPRLSLPLALALSACTSTADLTVEADPVVPPTVYAVTVAASPLGACAEPVVGDVRRASLVDLRDQRLLLLQLTTSPAMLIRPPGVCSALSGACGHFRVDLYESDDPEATPSSLYTSATVVELPVSPDVATVRVTLTLLDDLDRVVNDPAGRPVTTSPITIEVFDPGDPLCVAPVDGEN